MKSIFYLNDITCAISHTHICNKIKRMNGINDIYYNHLFSSFIVDYTEETDILKVFKDMNINVELFDDINLVVEKIVLKKIKSKKILIVSSVILAIQIVILFMPYSSPLLNVFINLLLNTLVLTVSLKSFMFDIKNLRNMQINDFSIKLILFLFSILFSILNILNSYFSFYSILATSIIVISNIYDYFLVIYKEKLFEKDENIPTTAIVKRDNKELEINSNDIKLNDIVVVKDRAILPVDGVIIDGFTQVDQSMFTSEIPIVNKSKNNPVVAGMINQSNYLEYRATSTNKKNTYNQRNKLILESVLSKNNLGYPLSLIYNNFHFALLAIGIVSFFIYYALTKSFNTSLLVITSLSFLLNYEVFEFIVPLNVFKCVKEYSKEGIIIKNSNLIEKINNCEVIMIENPGILIEEYPDVKDVFISEGIKPSDFYYIAYMLVKDSNSKYAITIKNYLKNVHLSSLNPDELKSTTRKGISKEEISKNYKYGNYKFFKNKKIDLSKVDSSIKRFQVQGKDSIIFIHNNNIIGILTIQNILRDDVMSTIKTLQNINKRIVLLDNSELDIAKYYSQKLNIKEYHCNLNHKQKSELVDSLYLEGFKTIYISKMENTKKSLKNAEVNISINPDIDFSINETDIIMVKPKISDILNIMKVSSKVISNIKANISLLAQVYGVLILIALLLTIYVNITPYLIIIFISTFPIILFIDYAKK